ncbi:MAG: peptide-methionine (R)-S-oxide reductase MsrB [Gammaproteobacteria bacterium]|nr:peptide-methionine (R)-S-oxide reductase MsrB [Gammaproteobacteria bacterium]MCP5459996.1 peptide-methionine (R)-S-oxide reductase MsrB [Gammaproteobacteria bacterium]
MQRRRFLSFLGTVTSLFTASVLAFRPRQSAAEDESSLQAIQQDWKKLLAADAQIATSTDPVTRPDAEWRSQLSPAAYAVLFEENTERPFTSPLNDEKRPGVFVCAACRLPLFSSAMKFDSGTGWPSFFTHIPGHLDTKTDFKLIWPRTEYHCVRCGGHQGHVFEDGPKPTGQRWCNNGVALDFIPA